MPCLLSTNPRCNALFSSILNFKVCCSNKHYLYTISIFLVRYGVPHSDNLKPPNNPHVPLLQQNMFSIKCIYKFTAPLPTNRVFGKERYSHRVYRNLPEHMVVIPLHVPLAWHVLMVDPLRMNPGSHLSSILLGNTVKSPEEEPFTGTDKGPHSTARK